MSMQDPIADMLTRIRNAQLVGHPTVSMAASKMKAAVSKVLTEEGYVDGYTVEEDAGKSMITVRLKYFEGAPVIRELKRVSRPGRREYKKKDELPSVANGLGIAIVSTCKGVITDAAARRAGVGGEVICTVF